MLENNNKMISEITELVTKVKSDLANEINKLPNLSAVNNMKFEVDSDV